MASDDFDIVIEAMLEAPYKNQEREFIHVDIDSAVLISCVLSLKYRNQRHPCKEKGEKSLLKGKEYNPKVNAAVFVHELRGMDFMEETPNQETNSDQANETNNNQANETNNNQAKETNNEQAKETSSSRSGKASSSSRRSRSRKRSRSRSHDRRRSRSRSRDRHRRRGSRDRHRSREHRHRSRSRGRRHSSRSRDCRRDERSRHRSPGRRHTRSKSRSPRHKEKSPIRQPEPILTPEERDARTVFCMQLAARIRPRDLEDFFSAVGKVRDVRIIADRNSRRSKGIAYVEFVAIQSVPLAIGLTGQRLLGVPIMVQASQAEKNRLAAMANNLQRGNAGPMRLYVGSLHFNITEDMLKGIFEPFGKIENIQLLREPDTGRSKGYGFITFSDAECARRALDQLNGFELAGRPMKVGNVTDRGDGSTDVSFLDNDDLERSGFDLGATGRLQLMAKLAEGSGLHFPLAAQAALQLNGGISLAALNPALSALNPALNLATQSFSSQCFPLSQLFNPQTM